MVAFLINVLLVELFLVLLVLTARGKRNLIDALIIFCSMGALKFFFLVVWSMHKTGTLDFDYLQFPDEYYYLMGRHPAVGFSNLYHLAVIGMRDVGFSIANIKMVNILLSSFAVVRLCSLSDLVRDKKRYVIYVGVFCGFLLFHVTYFSIFVLKDVLLFYVTVEFLISLVRRPVHGGWVRMIFWACVLVLIRPPMAMVFLVFAFDRNWRLRWMRLLLFVVLGGILIGYGGSRYRQKFYRLAVSGLYENAGMKRTGIKKSDMTEYGRTILTSQPTTYIGNVWTNIRSVVLIDSQKDLTIQLVLLTDWCIVLYLLVLRKNLRRLMKVWPILSIAGLYFIGGVFTLYNIRYHAFPATVVICMSVFVAARPLLRAPVYGRERFTADGPC